MHSESLTSHARVDLDPMVSIEGNQSFPMSGLSQDSIDCNFFRLVPRTAEFSLNQLP